MGGMPLHSRTHLSNVERWGGFILGDLGVFECVWAMYKLTFMVTGFGLSIIKDVCVGSWSSSEAYTGGEDGEVGCAGQGRVKDTLGYPRQSMCHR